MHCRKEIFMYIHQDDENVVSATSITNNTFKSIRQQIDESHHDLVNMLTHQMATVKNLMFTNANYNYQLLARQMGRLAHIFGAPDPIMHQVANAGPHPEPNIENRFVLVNQYQNANNILDQIRQNAGGSCRKSSGKSLK